MKISDVRKCKNCRKLAMLTCYDYAFAKIFDEAGVDILLVGDSLANVILGLENTRFVDIATMIKHTAAVARGCRKSLVVADMPYAAYQKKDASVLANARAFLRAGAAAVKVEWFSYGKNWSTTINIFKKLIKNKIPVMGHIGLTPQTAQKLGGYKVQGRDEISAKRLIEQAKILNDLGIFSLVLECIPWQLAKVITQKSKVPTFGIGAGKFCDGQVLVHYDMLGLYKRVYPKFVRQYIDLTKYIAAAVSRYKNDVEKGLFPADKESYSAPKFF